MYRRLKAFGTTGVVAVVVAALTFAVTGATVSPKAPKLRLISGTDFLITSTITAWPACTTAAVFAPGAQLCLTYTVHNPLHASISVTSLTTAIDPAYPAPAKCPASNLDLSHTAFSSPPSPALAVSGLGTNTKSVPISLADSHGDQDGCQNVTFHFVYTGTATYTEVYATSTALSSSHNPSGVGQAVTYTATVRAFTGAGQDPVPGSPTGSVTFKDGTTTICSTVPVASSSVTTSVATCSAPAYLAAATHPITAVYANADGNFSGSTSETLSQVVKPAATTTGLTTAPNPSLFGQAVSMTATVSPSPGPTGTVSFYLGTPSGSHALLGTASVGTGGKATFATSALPGGADSLYAVYSGDAGHATSTSSVITQQVNFTTACIATTVNGNLTVKSGQAICINGGGRINGSVTVQSGGALSMNAGTVNGSLTSSGATAIRLCSSNFNGNVTISGTAGSVVFGDAGDDGPSGCGANAINASNTSITNDSGGVEFGHNKTSGAVTVSGNTGAGPDPEDAKPEIEANTIGGGLACSSNSAAPIDDGQKNNVSGTRSGQCAAAGF